MTSRYFTLMAACMPPALALALTACASHPPAAPAAPPAEQAVMPAAKPAPAAEPAPAAAPTPPAAPAPAPLKLAAFHPNTPAAPHPPMPMGSQGRAVRLYIQAHDLNADQSVSPDEAERARHERFSQADTNQDGAVDLPEYLADSDARMTERLEIEQAQAAKRIAKRFEALSQGQSHISRARFDQAGERIWSAYSSAKLPEALPPAREKQHALAMPSTHSKAGLLALYDRNQDGKLTREEFKQGRETQFARADINRDARLSRAEYETDFRLCAQERICQFKARGSRQALMRFGALDTNRNDRIDWAEYRASSQQAFRRADRNNDGIVNAADAALPAPASETRADASGNLSADMAADAPAPAAATRETHPETHPHRAPTP